ncbi:MAG: pantoate--beta-alanine ligase [Bacteroidota bacterium]|nr:pantoate--beta-alanine ligase [Bacteroidota bacterium]
MIIVETVSELAEALNMMRHPGKAVGLVPTMGALHEGHASLVTKAGIENQIVVCSIFVNPTQFTDKKDLLNYPRTLHEDAIMLSDAGCDLLFTPSVKEIYPKDDLLDMDFGNLDKVMEGYYRPGHFKGVATVVSRFFEIIRPHKAYFGEKDFQQLAIIRSLRARLFPSITIVGCETIRETDGLAMSSRNIHLSTEERAHAGIIYQTLLWSVKAIQTEPVDQVKAQAIDRISAVAGFRPQYLEFVDSETLQPINSWIMDGKQRACVAVLASGTRLIDNIAM